MPKETPGRNQRRLFHSVIPHGRTRRRVLQVALFALLLAALLIARVSWAPDSLFLVMLGGFTLLGIGLRFLLNFGPFIGLLMSYDGLRGYADVLNKNVHFSEMINFDRWLTGVIPPNWLQQHLYHGSLQWYDYYFYFLYMMHFTAPILFAAVIWRTRSNQYWRYVLSFVVLSYLGFLTYVIFPAAPPWMAAAQGLIDPIHRLGGDIWAQMGVHDFPTLYAKFAPNQVAAVPSLHAAYPVLAWLFVRRLYGNRAAAVFAIYPLSMAFGVVYLGEHYLFDVLLGAAFAVGAYWAVNLGFDRFALRARRRRHARLSVPAVS